VGDPGELLPSLAGFIRSIPGNVARHLLPEQLAALGDVRIAFECEFPPPRRFLEWMIRNPSALTWPDEAGSYWRKLSPKTQLLRKQLKQSNPEAISHGLLELQKVGPNSSRHRWWAFEGFTSVDCWLETERLVIFIEGKRTESLSPATQWFPKRSQLVRNLEVASEYAGRMGKDFYVLLCTEEPMEVPAQTFTDSLPHLTKSEREAMAGHFLGYVTWETIRKHLCPNLELPMGLAAAADLCQRYRVASPRSDSSHA
jgi:hypothetical protein